MGQDYPQRNENIKGKKNLKKQWTICRNFAKRKGSLNKGAMKRCSKLVKIGKNIGNRSNIDVVVLFKFFFFQQFLKLVYSHDNVFLADMA